MTTKTHATARELAGLPGMPQTESAVIRLAKKECWLFQKRCGRGGGREYAHEALPEETRVALATHSGALCPLPRGEGEQAGAAAGERFLADLKSEEAARKLRKEQNLTRFHKLPEERRQEAHAKRELLSARDLFVRRAQLPIKRGSELFAIEYQAGRIELPEWVTTYARRSGRLSVSWSSLNRWQRDYQADGLLGLVNGYQGRPGNSLPDEIEKFIVGLRVDHPKIRFRRVLDAIKARFKKRERPSESAVRRFLKKFEQENASLLLYLENPDEWKNRHMLALGNASERAERLNQLWEFDSTPADLLLADGKRHTIIGVIDVYSRRLKLFVSSSSKAAAVAALVRRAILDWGVPETPKTDNGSDYVSKHLVGLFQALEIEQELCPPFTPEAKPHIERAFRTFSHGIVELLPGFVGHSVADRKAIEARKSFAQRMMEKDTTLELALTPEQLQKLCDDWCEAIYHQDGHAGLDGRTPADVVRAWQQPVRRVMDARALDMLLCPAPKDGGTRVIGKDGVQVNNSHYFGREMVDRVGETVLVKLDLTDLGTVYIYLEDGSFLCMAEDTLRKGIDRAEFASRAKHHQDQIIKAGARELRKIAREAGTKNAFQEILDDRKAEIANVVELPKPSVPYSTQALVEAARAAEAAAGVFVAQELPAEVIAAQKRMEEEMAADAEAKTSGQPRKVANLETPQARYGRWKRLEEKVMAGEELGDTDRRFYKAFVGSPDYVAVRRMEEDFGGDRQKM